MLTNCESVCLTMLQSRSCASSEEDGEGGRVESMDGEEVEEGEEEEEEEEDEEDIVEEEDADASGARGEERVDDSTMLMTGAARLASLADTLNWLFSVSCTGMSGQWRDSRQARSQVTFESDSPVAGDSVLWRECTVHRTGVHCTVYTTSRMRCKDAADA
jgi:hypothetical protein